jgi:LacI family transcriptional regulator
MCVAQRTALNPCKSSGRLRDNAVRIQFALTTRSGYNTDQPATLTLSLIFMQFLSEQAPRSSETGSSGRQSRAKKRPTLSDIAQVVGVSVMTVSRAINNKPGLSEDLRQRVLALANDIGFQPSQLARGLVTRKTLTIGLVVPDITNPFFAHIARGVEEGAYESGYNVYLINTAENPDREQAALTSLWQKEIDGAILCSLRASTQSLEHSAQRFPAAVLINRELSTPLPNVVTININDQRGAQMATQHFIDNKRRKIGYVAGPTRSISSQRRLEGFRQALRLAGITFDLQMVEHCTPNTDEGRLASARLLARMPDIEAIFAFNDLVAVGALQACQEAGKSVPNDVAIIGADDIPLATIIRPQLSTLRVNLGHIGRLSLRTLLEIVSGEASPASYQIEPELMLRDTA